MGVTPGIGPSWRWGRDGSAPRPHLSADFRFGSEVLRGPGAHGESDLQSREGEGEGAGRGAQEQFDDLLAAGSASGRWCGSVPSCLYVGWGSAGH